jgi:Tfp pilus assembly PilM family ATPase/Tfp pilus assembly protein PilN
MMRLTTLHIGSNSIKYMVFRDAVAVAWGTVPLTGVVKNGLIQDPAAAGQQLKSLFASGKIPGDRVICSINGLPFSYRFFTLPKMDALSVDEAITRMAKQEMPLAPEDMILSWRAYPAEKEEWQFLVTGVTRRPVDALIKTFSEAGIRPYLMCLPHLALPLLTSRANAIIVDFEPDYSNITLVVQGVPVGMHTVPSSGADANLQDATGQLIRELTRMTDFYNDNHPRNPITDTTAILLTGELANEPETMRLLQEKTGYPVEILKELPANTLAVPAEVPLATFAVNLGVALRDRVPPGSPAADPALVRDINLTNIIAERAGVKKHGGSGKKLILSSVIVLGVIGLITAYLSQNQTADKISQLKAELQQGKEQLAQNQESARLANQTEASIRQIIASTQQIKNESQNILNPRDSVSDLNFLTHSMPPSTFFNSIDVNTTQISIQGITAFQERVMEYVRILESSGIFTAANIIWLDKASSTGAGVSFLIVIIR